MIQKLKHLNHWLHWCGQISRDNYLEGDEVPEECFYAFAFFDDHSIGKMRIMVILATTMITSTSPTNDNNILGDNDCDCDDNINDIIDNINDNVKAIHFDDDNNDN